VKRKDVEREGSRETSDVPRGSRPSLTKDVLSPRKKGDE